VGADGDLRASALLPGLAATSTYCESDLELRAASWLAVWRRVEHRGAQRSDESVVGQARVMLVVEDHAGLAQQREGLGPQLEADDAVASFGVWWIVRSVARAMVGHQFLELPQVLAGRGREPGGFGGWRRDASQLADSGECEVAPRERRVELRQ